MNPQVMLPIQNGVCGFQSVVSDIYFPYVVEQAKNQEAFFSAVASVTLGNLRISRTYVNSPFLGTRLATRGGQHSPGYYILMLVEEGELCLRGSRITVATAGDLVLLDPKNPFESEQKKMGTTLSVKIPAKLLKLHYSSTDDWCLRALPTRDGSPALLRALLTSLWDNFGTIRTVDNSNLEGAFIKLLGAALEDKNEIPSLKSHSMGILYRKILEIINRNLDRQDLGGDFVASQLGISKSYMFMVMNAAGTTLRKFILDRRLEESRKLLADPATIDRTISEIAFSFGFQDLSHFSKRFSEKYGRSPRAYRMCSVFISETHKEKVTITN